MLITCLFLALEFCNVEPTQRKSWPGNVLICSHLTLNPSFKVKRGLASLKVLITLDVLDNSNVKPTYTFLNFGCHLEFWRKWKMLFSWKTIGDRAISGQYWMPAISGKYWTTWVLRATLRHLKNLEFSESWPHLEFWQEWIMSFISKTVRNRVILAKSWTLWVLRTTRTSEKI